MQEESSAGIAKLNESTDGSRPADESSLPWVVPTDESFLDLGTADAFGHVRYASAVEELIRTSPHGHTIGLFGGYGTGKTWIIGRLRQSLEPDAGIGVVEYNAWRYADDEIRRDFLLHIKQEMGQSDLFKGESPKITPDVFKVDLDTKELGPEKLSWPAVWGALKDSFLFGLILVVVSALLGLPIGLVVHGFPGGFVFLLSGGIGALSWVSTAVRSLLDINRLSVKTVTVTHKPRIEFPEEFLGVFQSIIAERKPERLVIVIDNLDRCAPDVAMKLLSTIKNFLEPTDEGVFFLIPCDVVALQRHLSAAFQARGLESDQADADSKEYLGKFFGSSISITGFDEPELMSLAEKDIRQTRFGVDLSDQQLDAIASIAAAANRQSPRELKVFLNKVASSWLLMQHSDNSGSISLSPIDLTKLHAIMDKAPMLWLAILEDPSALTDAETRLAANVLQDDDIGTALKTTTERRIVQAVQWHKVDESKVRVFIGLRMPPEAAGIPRYFEYQRSLEDADVETGIEIANEIEPTMIPNLLDLATSRVRGVAVRQSERAVNPALVGLALLAEFDLPDRQQREFLVSLPSDTLHSIVWRAGPERSARAALMSKSTGESNRIRTELINGIGDRGLSQEELAKGISSVAPLFTQEEKLAIREKIEGVLSADTKFEAWIRRLPHDVAKEVVGDESLIRLVQLYVLPADMNQPPETDEAIELLRAHSHLLHVGHLSMLGSAAEPYLVGRSESGIPFDDSDIKVIKEILSLAAAADLTPIDLLAQPLAHRISANHVSTYQQLGGQASDIEPLLAGEARGTVVKLVYRLLRGESDLSAQDELSLVTQASEGFSAESRQEVLTEASSILESTDNEDILDFGIDLARSLHDLGGLTAVAIARSTSSPSSFEWLRTQLAESLEPDELKIVLKGTIDGLIGFLESPDDFVAAAVQLIRVRDLWLKGRAQQIISQSVPYLSSEDPTVAEHSVQLIQASIDLHLPRNTGGAREAAVEALVDGPLGINGPDSLFNFQLESIQQVRYSRQLEVRGMVRDRMQAGDGDLTKVFIVAKQLAEANPGQHSDPLFRPAVDFAISADDPSRAEQATELLQVLQPGDDEFERNLEGLYELRGRELLPEPLEARLKNFPG